MNEHRDSHADAAAQWEADFAEHARRFHALKRLMRRLPADPRCKVCAAPFKGFGGALARPFGYGQSRKNPNLCDVCIEASPDGGFESEGGILFADVRGYTRLSEGMSPSEVATLMNRFYAAASGMVFAEDGILDKLVGDEVMALFWPPLIEGDAAEKMVAAAEGLLRAVGYGSDDGSWLEVGVGLDYGPAYVGNVGGGEVRDFTALGDVVNTAARLQTAAEGGQIVVSERVYERVAERWPAARRVELPLKGKAKPVAARVVDLGEERRAQAG